LVRASVTYRRVALDPLGNSNNIRLNRTRGFAPRHPDQRMSTLHIALQEGFTHDDVRIEVDGAQVYSRQDVSTRQQLGLADSFDTQVDHDATHVDGCVTVRVALATRHTQEEFVVPLHEANYVGISVDRNGGIRRRMSATPFGYV
jgi:hypothetical protein